jgi:methylenetetrahydrofolate dehydrogenase (NADP+) / methenyltetrahydrofolate cyclohydrolase / formyltetrahydrofolate synthetase
MPGTPLASEYTDENLELVRAGCANMEKHIANLRLFGVQVLVAVNRFSSDSPAEVALVQERATAAGAVGAYCCEHWAKGGEGVLALGDALVKACENKPDFRFLYALELSIKEKIALIAKRIYGAAAVSYSEEAEARIAEYTRQGFGELPICVAKTHLSLSHDPKLVGVPTGFTLPVCDIRASVGAGFLYPLIGTMSTMPGLPTRPSFFDIDLDLETGNVVGLF